MKHSGKSLAGILAVCVLLFALIFTGVQAIEMGHDCSGEGCPVCQILTTARTFSKTLCAALSLGALSVFLLSFLKEAVSGRTEYCRKTSPVTLKVKLSN